MAKKRVTKTRSGKKSPAKRKPARKQVSQERPVAAAEQQPVEAPIIPIHQWTHDGTKVRILKCVDKDGRGYGGFQWPRDGNVKPTTWSPKPTCKSGGLFGWAWGLGRGGKTPDYSGIWIVFEAAPADVVVIEDKVKAATGEVIYYGDWWTAIQFTEPGRIAWIEHSSRGAASATGSRGAASATGSRGAASATGESGAASATGESGAASATGESGAAVVTGKYSTVEAGPTCVAVAMAETVYWRVRIGAVLLQRWGTEYRLLTTDGLADGELVAVVRGEIERSK